MRKCPFCNNEISLSDAWFTQFNDGKWVLYHYCPHEDGELGAVITIYGKTREEILAKLDGVYYAKEQTSESL